MLLWLSVVLQKISIDELVQQVGAALLFLKLVPLDGTI